MSHPLKRGLARLRARWMHGGFSATPVSDTAPLAFTKMHFSAARCISLKLKFNDGAGAPPAIN